jgi:CPA1 family monovalent cation:H+ antiporter
VLQFWSLVDEMLNSVLFLLIGLEVIAIAVQKTYLVAGIAAIFLVLVARTAAVGLPMAVFSRLSPFTRGAFPVMVWGGLRGGISIALALALPEGAMKELILTVTYVIVVFSVIVQGATVGRVARRTLAGAVDPAGPPA